MNKLKHIKLFEAFKSDILSGTLKYINSEIRKEFLDKIKDICEIYDFPPSELSDKFFEYLPYRQALKFGEIKDETYLIKFWFSSDGKLLEITGTGEELKSYEKGNELKADELRKLETGTKVIVDFNDYDNTSTISSIFKWGSNIFFIQNRMDGSKPDYDYSWEEYGKYSWIYTNSEKCYEVVYKDSPEINYYIDIKDSIEMASDKLVDLSDSHFAIILNLENIKKSDYKVSKKREIRSKEKIGALALKSDEEIKKINIERYIDSIVKKSDIDDEDIKDIKNIKYLIANILGKNSLIDSISEVKSSYRTIQNLSDLFLNLMKYEYDANYYITSIKRLIESVKRDNLNNGIKISENINKLKLEIESISSDDEKVKFRKLLDHIIESKKLLNEKIKSFEIESIEDLYILEEKLNGLGNISRRVDTERYFFRRLYEKNSWNILPYIDDIDQLLKSMNVIKNYIKNF